MLQPAEGRKFGEDDQVPRVSSTPPRCYWDQVKDKGNIYSHAQPLASSMVSARSEVVLEPVFFSRLLSLRMSFASMLTLATSFTMHPILSLEFPSRYLSRVVFPANRLIRILNQSHYIQESSI